MKKTIFILCALLTLNTFASRAEARRYREYPSLKAKEHMLTNLSTYSSLIRIEDGSHFKIPNSDLSTLSDWRPGDLLIITPNEYYFSFYTYSIRNTTLGESVLANLHYGPSVGNRFSKQVEEIDRRTGLVELTDGSYWIVSDADLSKFNLWEEYDYIIIGASKSSSYKNILINVTLNHYIEANPYE